MTSAVPSTGFWEGTPARVTGGFEYELARALARRLGERTVRVVLEPFKRIVAGRLDDADLALDLISPTSERGRHLDFSDSYLNAPPTVVTRTGTTVPDLEAARDLRWGALEGTTFIGMIDTLIAPEQHLRTFVHDSDMIAALKRHQIDAILLDMPYAVVTADTSNGKLHAVAQLPVSEQIVAALPKGSTNVEAVDSAINAFNADGTIDALLKRWIGASAADSEKSIPLLNTNR